MHPRQAGLEPEFVGLMPDYLEGLTLHTIGTICAALEFKRDTFLLEAAHIAPQPVSVEQYARSVRNQLRATRTMSFSQLLAGEFTPRVVVVTLLAVLELFKQGFVLVEQTGPYGEITVTALDRIGADDEEEKFDEYL